MEHIFFLKHLYAYAGINLGAYDEDGYPIEEESDDWNEEELDDDIIDEDLSTESPEWE